MSATVIAVFSFKILSRFYSQTYLRSALPTLAACLAPGEKTATIFAALRAVARLGIATVGSCKIVSEQSSALKERHADILIVNFVRVSVVLLFRARESSVGALGRDSRRVFGDDAL